MAESKVVINLASGLEDSERVTVAFLVGRSRSPASGFVEPGARGRS